jgi:nicotinamidase-related amidase
MSYTLLVIDMQKGFLQGFRYPEEKEKVIEGCRRAVMKAIADGAEILDVNYRGSYGPTIPEIRNLWKGYKKYFKGQVKKVMKCNDGGGDEVMEVTNNDPLNGEFIACGVNAGACVRSTVLELVRDHGKTVYVIGEAVANCWGGCEGDLDYYDENGMLTNL